MKHYVFDSFAVLTYFYEQDGTERIEQLLVSLKKQSSKKAWLSLINLGEVYYIIARNEGFSKADQAIVLLKKWPIEILVPGEKITLSAARIKASYALSYADAFVVASAIEKQAVILTGDPEFSQLKDLVQVEWIGPRK